MASRGLKLRKHQKSSSHSGTSTGGSKPTQVQLASLDHMLPTGWGNFFSARLAGRYAGLSTNCPICGEAAPRELHYSHRKWRWTTVHMAVVHNQKARKIS